MKQSNVLRIAFGAIVIMLLLAGCGSRGRVTPTARPTWAPPTRTPVVDTATPVVSPAVDTATPAVPPIPDASATPTVVSLITVTPVIPTSVPPSATPTEVPPTWTPTSTSVPPTATPLPTQTPVPPTATNTPMPPVVITDWRGEYFGNALLQGPALVVRNDVVVDLTVPAGSSPARGLPSQSWSARWSRTWTFDEGSYRFHLLVDDGARLWVGGRLLIDAWTDGPARAFTGDLYLKGSTPIQLDYYNHLGDGRVRLNWERVVNYEGWIGSYYANRELSGLPVFQRDDLDINFNWGTGSPRADLQADDFGVRWTRRLSFDTGGTYHFRIEADDGVRLWVDGNLIIDAWQDGPRTLEKLVDLSPGQHDVRLEYYEHLGDAIIKLALAPAPPTPTATSTPTTTPVPTQPPTPTATPIPTEPPKPTPLPGKPKLILKPDSGPIGASFEALGTGWPAGAHITLYLVRPVPGQDKAPWEPVAETRCGEDGSFSVQLEIPAGQGWEGLPTAIVVAQSLEHDLVTETEYTIQPKLSQVPFEPIVTEDKRLALPEPTYLVLDSQEAWVHWFGEDPFSLESPIDWERDIVIGAFPGQQERAVSPEISSIVQRESVVSIWLGASEQDQKDPGQEEKRSAALGALARVPRRGLEAPERKGPSELVFAFLDASGTLLAQGPVGEWGLITAPDLPERMPFRAPAGAQTPAPSVAPLEAEASPAPDAQPKAVEEAAEGEPSVLESPGEPEEESPEIALEVAPPEAQAAEADQTETTFFQWLWTGAGLALLIGGMALILVILGAYAWRRLR